MRVVIYSADSGDPDRSVRPLPLQFMIYLLALIVIPAASYYRQDAPVVLLCLLYLLYDVWFYAGSTTFRGRDTGRILGDLRAACGYMAYFLPLAGGVLAFADLDKLQPIVRNDWPIFVYLLVGLVCAAVATLFIPVQYAVTDDDMQTPSRGLRLCFVTVLFLQKVAVTAVSCAIIRAGLVSYHLCRLQEASC